MTGSNPTGDGAISLPAEIINAVRWAEHVVVLTGAGVSAESGVPTFRDAQTGLWATYKPEDLASVAAYRATPKLVWDWYAWRRELVTQAQPNAAHLALTAMQDIYTNFTLITQNVDGLHQRAGSHDVLELHGNLFRYKCLLCDQPATVDEWRHRSDVPACIHCGGAVRPDIVWFGEMLPSRPLAAAQFATRHCDLFLAIGTSSVVFPAAGLPLLAMEKGALVIEINPSETDLSDSAQFSIHDKAGAVLPALVHAKRNPN